MNAPEKLAPKAKAKFAWDDPLLLADQLTAEDPFTQFAGQHV
jgi:hypothetical protein